MAPDRWMIFRPFAARLALIGVVTVLVGVFAARMYPCWTCPAAVRAAFAAGRFADADRVLARWLHSCPNDAAAHYFQARAALALGRPAEVELHAREARRLGCPRADLMVLTALNEVARHEFAQAVPVLRDARELKPEPDPQLDRALAQAYLETFQLAAAAEPLARWARDAPGDPTPYLWRVEVHRRTNESLDVVIADFREALRCDPHLAQAQFGLADALREAHRNHEAAAEYAAFLALRPDDASGHLGAGRNARELGDLDAAATHLAQALTLDPARAATLGEWADLALARGEPGRALEAVDKAVALDPYEPRYRTLRIRALRGLGRTEEAQRESERLDQVRKQLARLEDLKARLARAPQDRDLQAGIAEWMIEHDHIQEGVRWAEKVVREQPDHPLACRLLADYHERKGEKGRANFYRLSGGSGR